MSIGSTPERIQQVLHPNAFNGAAHGGGSGWALPLPGVGSRRNCVDVGAQRCRTAGSALRSGPVYQWGALPGRATSPSDQVSPTIPYGVSQVGLDTDIEPFIFPNVGQNGGKYGKYDARTASIRTKSLGSSPYWPTLIRPFTTGEVNCPAEFARTPKKAPKMKT
eukprot:2064576-Pyramimonas_sp.AAC.1